MALATPISLGPKGTPIRDVGSSGLGTPVVVSTDGNATPCVLTASGPALNVRISTIPTNAATTAWVNAVIGNGGTVSAAQQFRVNLLITQLVASGAWALTDDLWLLVSESAIQSLTSLKQLRLATAVNAPTFVAGAGYTFNGTSSYIDTGFIAITHAVAMTGTNMRIVCYERSNVFVSNVWACGAQVVTTRNLGIIPANSVGRCTAALNFSTALAANGVIISATSSRGLRACSRNAVVEYFSNGASAGVVSPTLGSTLPNIAMFLGCVNSAGSPAAYRGATEGFFAVGAALSAAQELSFYSAVQTYMTQWGAQV